MPKRYGRDADPRAELLNFLESKLRPEDLEDATKLVDAIAGIAQDDPLAFPGMPRTGGAMDARLAYDHNTTSAGRIVADRERAIAEVEGVVGRSTVIACDSAASVFRAALGHIGIDAKTVHVSALATMWHTARTRRDDQPNAGYLAGGGVVSGQSRSIASSSSFAQRHPNAARIRTV